MSSTRRRWLSNCLTMAACADVAAAQQHAHASAQAAAPPRLDVLDPAAAAEIEAIACEILPSTDGPGAREAGVIFFIDRALLTFDADKREAYRTGMAEVRRKRLELFPGSAGIAALGAGQRIALLQAIETTPFFELVRTHTLLGFLGNPSYGGNRGRVGWKHIGFEDRMAFQPPFGYYDAQEPK